MVPGLGDGRGSEGLAPLYPYWEGAGQYLESDLLCSGVGMVPGRQRIADLTQLGAPQRLNARWSEREPKCRCGIVIWRRASGWMEHPSWERATLKGTDAGKALGLLLPRVLSHWKLEITAF